MALAKTAAAGGPGLDPRVLAFSSSMQADRALFEADVAGSLAHVAMLGRAGIIAADEAARIHAGLVALYMDCVSGVATLPDEEDVHMAIETLLTERIGEPAKRMHSARSRNDQVATALRLHVRDQVRGLALALSRLVEQTVHLAEANLEVIMPSYTHRQRAQPVSAAYWLLSYASGFFRDLEAISALAASMSECPLGAGAIAGTSLAVDRAMTAKLLGFSKPTRNGMDTVGDRDFLLDYLHAVSKVMIRAGRLCTDVIDYATGEFGYIKLDDAIACGSSMMPQKKNPDLFELVRGKSGGAVGNLVAMLVTMKGLPGGYNRDQQEDRGPLLATNALWPSVLDALSLGLSHIRFDADRTASALRGDATQATDVAEALVRAGMPFRDAYAVSGKLVKDCQNAGIALADAGDAELAALDEPHRRAVCEVLDPAGSVARKRSYGSTGPEPVRVQIAELREQTRTSQAHLQCQVPSLADLLTQLQGTAP